MRYLGAVVMGRDVKSAILRAILISLMIAATALAFTLPALAQNKYVIHDGDNVIVCMSTSEDPREVLEEAGLTLGHSDTYTTEEKDGDTEIRINRVQMISVFSDGQMFVVGSYGETVSDILSATGIELDETSQVNWALNTQTFDGMQIRVVRVTTEVVEYDAVTPHVDNVYEDASLEPGETVVLVEGKDGVTHCRAEVVYEDGKEVRRTILSEEVLSVPTEGLILQGVDRSVKQQENSGNDDYRLSHAYSPDGVSASTSSQEEGNQYIPGTTQVYSEVLEFTATAYTCEGYVGTTAIGSTAREGAVAVDPRVIPLGTKMYIVSSDGKFDYGYCTAEDTGSAITGNIVDLYYDTLDECYAFGRRNVKIYILD